MKIAAGVLILVMAAMNLVGGCGAVFVGGIMGGIGGGVGELANNPEFAGNPDMAEAGTGLLAIGGSVLLIGVVMLVLGGLEIAAGVQLFRSKGATFIIVVAGIELAKSLLSFAGGFEPLLLIGVVAGILAIMGAKAISAVPAPVAAPTPTPAPAPAAGKAEADSD